MITFSFKLFESTYLNCLASFGCCRPCLITGSFGLIIQKILCIKLKNKILLNRQTCMKTYNQVLQCIEFVCTSNFLCIFFKCAQFVCKNVLLGFLVWKCCVRVCVGIFCVCVYIIREGVHIIGLFIALVPKVLLKRFLICWLNNFGDYY